RRAGGFGTRGPLDCGLLSRCPSSPANADSGAMLVPGGAWSVFARYWPVHGLSPHHLGFHHAHLLFGNSSAEKVALGAWKKPHVHHRKRLPRHFPGGHAARGCTAPETLDRFLDRLLARPCLVL